jgi:hypothetical protein
LINQQKVKPEMKTQIVTHTITYAAQMNGGDVVSFQIALMNLEPETLAWALRGEEAMRCGLAPAEAAPYEILSLHVDWTVCEAAFIARTTGCGPKPDDNFMIAGVVSCLSPLTR